MLSRRYMLRLAALTPLFPALQPANAHAAENKKIPLIPEATVVSSGVVRVMELQEQG